MPGQTANIDLVRADVTQWRDGFNVLVSKDKVRGKGRSLSLRYTSVPGKDFDLLGWGIWYSKNTGP